ncbi:HPr kinase/phosphorylase [Pontivivens insulae]|uniref:HPr kinase/phosphorylase n=1 Tax=Pontivivens insulae TaxID=1639689 RepID=UPI0013C2D8D9|nr:HPr kinase/phosphatase C-terminal domain-containing protein [Pontivivens insulae]
MSRTIHASAVSGPRGGVLVTGASGSGKSTLVLALLARGAMLIADDRTVLSRQNGSLVASAPAPLRGRVEARGIGLVGLAASSPAPVVLHLDLDRRPTSRMPEPQIWTHDGVDIPSLCGRDVVALADTVWLWLSGAATLDILAGH